MALTQDQLDKMRDDLVVALGSGVVSTRYGDKAVQYRTADELLRILRLLGWPPQTGDAGAAVEGPSGYKLATIRTKGYRAPGQAAYSYKTSGDFAAARPWNRG